MLRNPVLQRELIEHLRHPRSFLLQGIFLGLLSAIVLLAWPQETRLLLNEGRSRLIFALFATGQFLIVGLLVPVLAAPAIAGEQERKSLELLLTTPLGAGAVVFGKFASAAAYLLLLALSALPITATCLLLGGVGPREIIGAYVLILAVGVFAGALGLLLSASLCRTRNALAIAYAILLPLLAAIVASGPMLRPAVAWNIGVGLIIGAVHFLAFAASRVRTAVEYRPRTAEEEDPEEQIGLVLDRRRFPDSLISPRGTGRPLPLSPDPLLEKEIRWELFGQGSLLIRTLLLASLLTSLAFIIASITQGLSWIYSSYLIGFLLLIGPALAAGCFTLERERSTADLLLTLPISSTRLLRTKLLANLRALAILAGLPAGFFLIIWFFHLVSWQYPLGRMLLLVVMTALTLGGVLVTVVAVTALASLLSRTTLRAMIASYLALLLPFAAPIPIHIFLTELFGMSPERIGWLLRASPVYGLICVENWLLGEAVSDRFASLMRIRGAPFTRGAAFSDPLGAPVNLALLLAITWGAWTALRRLYPAFFQYRHDRAR